MYAGGEPAGAAVPDGGENPGEQLGAGPRNACCYLLFGVVVRVDGDVLDGVTACERPDEEGGPDIRLSYRDGPLLTVECKNVARDKDRHGNAKVDFQRTRAAKGSPARAASISASGQFSTLA